MCSHLAAYSCWCALCYVAKERRCSLLYAHLEEQRKVLQVHLLSAGIAAELHLLSPTESKMSSGWEGLLVLNLLSASFLSSCAWQLGSSGRDSWVPPDRNPSVEPTSPVLKMCVLFIYICGCSTKLIETCYNFKVLDRKKFFHGSYMVFSFKAAACLQGEGVLSPSPRCPRSPCMLVTLVWKTHWGIFSMCACVRVSACILH